MKTNLSLILELQLDNMITRCPTQWSVFMVLAIVSQLLVSIQSSSISSTKGEQQHATGNQQPQQLYQTPSSTALPTLLTTIVQDHTNYAKTKQHQSQHNVEGTKQRSNTDEHEEMPLATINNHSRNNQAALRPPQYVDVSALVGSRNLSNSYGAVSGSANSNSIVPNSMLSPKSRSGLPECATQQVCNAIFVRMNHTQRLCECSSNYNWKCSNNLDPQDGHTIELTRKFDKRIYTQIKTCEPLREVRACKSPTDWTLLALQSERSGKAHYVVVCKCPTWAQLEGPYTHNHPPYANIPGIRVYGMLCAHQTARSSSAQSYAAYNPALGIYPEFPWTEALNVLNTTNLASNLANNLASSS